MRFTRFFSFIDVEQFYLSIDLFSYFSVQAVDNVTS
jgi:hypothetical protein